MTSEVTSEDQVKINKFAILHDKYGVIKAKLAQKHVCFVLYWLFISIEILLYETANAYCL